MSSIFPQFGLEALQHQADRPVATRVRVRLPKQHYAQPVISQLISHHGLNINIMGALLGASGQEDGWFDFLINGEATVITDALLDLLELDAELWIGFEGGRDLSA